MAARLTHRDSGMLQKSSNFCSVRASFPLTLSTSTPTRNRTYGSGFRQLEFGTTRRSCPRTSPAVFISRAFAEALASTSCRECGTGSGRREFETTRRACSRSSLAILISKVSISPPTRSCGTGSGEFEFGTTRHTFSSSHLAVLGSETSRSWTPNWSCGIGSGELEFEKTCPACSHSHLAVLILEASTSTPCRTCGTGFGEFGTASRACARSSSGFHLLRVSRGLNLDAILGMWHWVRRN